MSMTQQCCQDVSEGDNLGLFYVMSVSLGDSEGSSTALFSDLEICSECRTR